MHIFIADIQRVAGCDIAGTTRCITTVNIAADDGAAIERYRVARGAAAAHPAAEDGTTTIGIANGAAADDDRVVACSAGAFHITAADQANIRADGAAVHDDGIARDASIDCIAAVNVTSGRRIASVNGAAVDGDGIVRDGAARGIAAIDVAVISANGAAVDGDRVAAHGAA